mmetsp:Transcript_12560/g.35936  ORF Transcript_12560/g.35936 Transcript_12560/m.35936 type:complete len:256 (-) Transcript_12560:901-1668(-)
MPNVPCVVSVQHRGGGSRGIIAFYADEDGFLTGGSACRTRRALTSVHIICCKGSFNVATQVQCSTLADHMHHVATIATAVLSAAIFKVVGKHTGILSQAKLILSHVESPVAILLSDDQEDKPNQKDERRHGNNWHDGAIDATCTLSSYGTTCRSSASSTIVFILTTTTGTAVAGILWRSECRGDGIPAICVPLFWVCFLFHLIAIVDPISIGIGVERVRSHIRLLFIRQTIAVRVDHRRSLAGFCPPSPPKVPAS